MPWSKNKRFEKIIYLLVTSALLILAGTSLFQSLRLAFLRTVNDFFYPYLSVPADLKYSLSDKSLLIHDKYTLAAKVEQLLRENQQLAAKSAVNAELSIDNEELRKTLRLQPRKGYDFIIAEIILRNPQAWQENFTINKGSFHGISKGAIALATGSDEYKRDAVAVGVIRNLSRHTAEISTIINPGTKIAAMLPRSGAFGFLNGGEESMGDGLANIAYLSANRTYNPGEPVFTAGAREQIPAGIYLGSLTDIQYSGSVFSNRLYLSAKVKPGVNMDTVRYVVIAVKRE